MARGEEKSKAQTRSDKAEQCTGGSFPQHDAKRRGLTPRHFDLIHSHIVSIYHSHRILDSSRVKNLTIFYS